MMNTCMAMQISDKLRLVASRYVRTVHLQEVIVVNTDMLFSRQKELNNEKWLLAR